MRRISGLSQSGSAMKAKSSVSVRNVLYRDNLRLATDLGYIPCIEVHSTTLCRQCCQDPWHVLSCICPHRQLSHLA